MFLPHNPQPSVGLDVPGREIYLGEKENLIRFQGQQT
jgi:hypothetical protein